MLTLHMGCFAVYIFRVRSWSPGTNAPVPQSHRSAARGIVAGSFVWGLINHLIRPPVQQPNPVNFERDSMWRGSYSSMLRIGLASDLDECDISWVDIPPGRPLTPMYSIS